MSGVDVLCEMDEAFHMMHRLALTSGMTGDHIQADAMREARDSVAEAFDVLRMSAEALESAAKCVGDDLAIVLADRAMLARAALANVTGGAA